ncbi:hypothetical protein [Hymenobacter sp. GOD-10R]|uniref:hypothetical protein n=1 Tax=Hymenobacter sp. GOD-10R TaxID=3093922 RepID=UPI002D7712EB|nr:hypothetical protein [Hymenobacter sp. GOD-10R]WRQ26705.1 hypothetical protein SD425_16655 [Hymenobacter sp. GOD-10R]
MTLEQLQELNKDKAVISTGSISTIGFTKVGNTLTAVGVHEFDYTYFPLKKDGTQGKVKSGNLSIVHTFCPFCGAKYEEA